MFKKLKKKFENCVQKIYTFFSKKAELKKIKSINRKILYKNIRLTKDQKDKIQKFYLSYYGKRVPLYWHRYYYSFSQNFDYRIFPDILFIPILEKKFNPRLFTNCLEDKNNISLLFSNIEGVNIPKTYLSRINGIFRTNDYKIISESDALNILVNLGDSFVKPTVESDSGRNCQKINFENLFKEIGRQEFIKYVETLGNNFVVQEIIKTHNTIERLNPSSVNTFRIMTVLLKTSEIFISPVIMRMGIGDSIVDNAHAGGIFIGVNENGFLQSTAFTEFGKSFIKHPTSQILFDNYKIDNFPKVLEAAKKLHSRIPQVRIASWDFTIDTEGNVVFIEVNLKGQSIWLQQIAWGVGAFGEQTALLLEEISLKRK